MSDSVDIINEYKDQVRILKQEVAELQDAGKSKDSANKKLCNARQVKSHFVIFMIIAKIPQSRNVLI